MYADNNVTLLGNLRGDPVLRTSHSGHPVCNFQLAVDRSPDSTQPPEIINPRGEGVDFIPIVVWGETANSMAKYLQRGSQICVNGYLRTRRIQMADGRSIHTIEIHTNNIKFLKNIKAE